jgi:hypothetical protein
VVHDDALAAAPSHVVRLAENAELPQHCSAVLKHFARQQFELDSQPGDAVHSQPVSNPNSLVTGKNTGKLVKTRPTIAQHRGRRVLPPASLGLPGAYATVNGNITKTNAQQLYHARLAASDPEAMEIAKIC